RVEKTVIREPFPTHLLFLTDVTEVEEATREYDRREHLEALAKAASGIAHEVRNPLNTIDMSIQTLCMEPSTLHQNDRETLESLRKEIERINSIVEHFLAYGRPKPPCFSTVDINAILQEILTFLEPSMRDKKIYAVMKLNSKTQINADAQQIKQALLNIILNAMEASRENSEILLTTEDQGDAVVCACRDHGCGMTEEQMKNIFDPYVSDKPKGTGLGMGIVKRILDDHGGAIRIDSAPDQGTMVELRFPASMYQGGDSCSTQPS
ncbi:MAG: sensor histidine kinase, partial [Candidatus Hinthialibacter sp.]